MPRGRHSPASLSGLVACASSLCPPCRQEPGGVLAASRRFRQRRRTTAGRVPSPHPPAPAACTAVRAEGMSPGRAGPVGAVPPPDLASPILHLACRRVQCIEPRLRPRAAKTTRGAEKRTTLRASEIRGSLPPLRVRRAGLNRELNGDLRSPGPRRQRHRSRRRCGRPAVLAGLVSPRTRQLPSVLIPSMADVEGSSPRSSNVPNSGSAHARTDVSNPSGTHSHAVSRRCCGTSIRRVSPFLVLVLTIESPFLSYIAQSTQLHSTSHTSRKILSSSSKQGCRLDISSAPTRNTGREE